jgi:membrane protease YdiL (CAAX protease family)
MTAGGAVLLVLVNFAAFLGVLLLGSALSGEEETISVAFRIAAALVAPLTALYVGLLRHAPAEDTRAALRLLAPTRPQWRSIALALVCGAALGPLVTLTYEYLLSLLPPDPEAQPLSATDLVLLAGAQLVAAALLEALYRGLVQPRLVATLGARRGLGVTVLIFIVGQVNALTIPASLLTAAVTGIAAFACGSTWAAIVASVAMQAVVVLMPDGMPPLWLVGAGAGVAAAALYALWRLRPATA